MTKGKYIVIEGIDGAGKTTQYGKLLEYLGNETVGVREPGGTDMAEKLRDLIKYSLVDRSPRTNVYLFAAARAELIDNKIRSAITAGKLVLSDRNWLSSAAYQSGEGVSADEILAVNKLATQEFFVPDLVVFLDLEPEICLARMESSEAHGGKDYFDDKGPEFFKATRESYLKYIKQLKNYAIIDASKNIDEVFEDIKIAVAKV